jgi:DNA-binding MurR/RpiR family transcriptional regulator
MADTKTTAPTPGPWRIERRHHSGINGAAIVGADGTRVVTITNKADKPIDQKVADAEIIVAAVNEMLRR